MVDKPPNFAAWESAIVASSAAGRKPVAPILVCIDGLGGGLLIPVGWQTGYVEAVKAVGGTVEGRNDPTDDHFSLPRNCVADARAWLTRHLGAATH